MNLFFESNQVITCYVQIVNNLLLTFNPFLTCVLFVMLLLLFLADYNCTDLYLRPFAKQSSFLTECLDNVPSSLFHPGMGSLKCPVGIPERVDLALDFFSPFGCPSRRCRSILIYSVRRVVYFLEVFGVDGDNRRLFIFLLISETVVAILTLSSRV